MDESFGVNSSPLDNSLLNTPAPDLMEDMSGEMDNSFLCTDSGSIFPSLLPESQANMASEVDFQAAATDFSFDFDTNMSYPEPMMNNGWNSLDPGLGASIDDALIDPLLLIRQGSSSLPVRQDNNEVTGFAAPLQDSSSLLIPERCNEMTDIPYQDFDNFLYADTVAFAAPYSHPVEDIVSESISPQASAQPLSTVRGKYAHFSVPIDTPQDFSTPSGSPIFLRRSGVKLHRAQVQNPLPCLDEVGWHPGQQPPPLQFVYPPLTPPGQTSAADLIPSTPSALYRSRPVAQMVSNSVDDEYFRLVEQHETNKARKSKQVSEINRTMKKAMQNVVRAGAQQYSSITGKAVTPLPRKRTAVRTADGAVSLKTDHPAPLTTTRRGGARKAKTQRRKCKYVEVPSDSDEVTDYEGEDSSSAGESDAEREEEDDDDDDEGLQKLPGNRKRSAERGVGLRRSKRARRPASRMG